MECQQGSTVQKCRR